MYFPTFSSKNSQIERIMLPVLIVLAGIALVMAYGDSAVSNPASLSGSNGAPLSFIPNVGQSDSSTLYMLQQSSMGAAFNESGLTFSWTETDGKSPVANWVDLQYVGTSATAVQSDNLLPGVVNYLQGSNRANWHTNIPTYSEVSYRNLYPGVDLVYSGSGRELLATFQLESGADLDKIAWQFAEAKAEVDVETGALTLSTDGRQLPIQLGIPQAWQTEAGESVAVAVNYAIDADGVVGLSAVKRMSADPAVVVLSMTLLGGGGEDFSADIAADDFGNVYATGHTNSIDFPTSNPLQPYAGLVDIFVSKFSADGSVLLFSTFIGGSDSDYARAINVDGNGTAYITGLTYSNDFPMVSAYQPTLNGFTDVFITTLSSDGANMLYSSYLGGSSDESGIDIFARGDNLFLTGTTLSNDFPTANSIQPIFGGQQDSFITKLNLQTNALVFSSFLGGSADDAANGMAVDNNDNIILTGRTNSLNFPTMNALQNNNMGSWDFFITAVAADGGSYLYSTYLGGSGADRAQGVAIGNGGNAYIVGLSRSDDFPVSVAGNPGSEDAVLAAISSDGSALLYSRLIGGSDDDAARDIALDGNGNKYLLGNTASSDFPLQNELQGSLSGWGDLFVMKLNGANEIVFSTYLGGENSERAIGIDADSAQKIYIIGDTLSFDYPVINAFQPGYKGGSGDVVVTKIDGASYTFDYSTYLGGGPYPGNPTAVSMNDFNGRSRLSSALLYLVAALLLILLVGGMFIRRQRNRH